MASTEYQRKYFKASYLLNKALRIGQLVRPETCELCDATPGPKPYHYGGEIRFKVSIQAHHWLGYDYPTDVWWSCQLCNSRLKGRENHAGTITKEQAREIVKVPGLSPMRRKPHDPRRE